MSDLSFAFRANALITRSLPVKLVRSRLTRPVASVTFDDFPRSAWTIGGPLLEQYGARGTYYAAACFQGERREGLAYFTPEDLGALQAAGHEVGAHSFAHRRAPELSRQALLGDAAENDRALEPHLTTPLTSYAYPYGAVTPRTKLLMGERYACARGITPGINTALVDLAQLRAIPLESRRWVPGEIDAAVERAVASSGWAIFFTHDVQDDPSPFGCTPAMLEHALKRLQASAVDVLPVRHAMARTVFGEG